MHFAPQNTRTFFLTMVTAQRRRLFQVESRAELFLSVLSDCREKKRFEVHAHVIMPDHVHLLLTPAHAIPLEKAVQFIKGGFSFRLKSKLDVWERGYNETRVRDTMAYENFKTYIEHNPVRACMVQQAEEYKYSSALAAMDQRPAWFAERSQG